MILSKTNYDKCTLVSVEGEIDHNNARTLAEALESITDAKRYNIVLDLEQVQFMSSAGLRVLVSHRTICTNHNGDLVLANVPKNILKALDLVGFIKFYKIYDEVDEAIGSFD